MKNENVYSPVEDKEIAKNLNGSPIWKQAYHESELNEAKTKHAKLFKYSMKFDGLKPVQITDIKEVLN